MSESVARRLGATLVEHVVVLIPIVTMIALQ